MAPRAHRRELGRELHKRLSTFSGHLSKIGTNLNSALRAYNAAAGSFSSRVLVSARKFREFGASTDDEIDAPALVEGGSTPLLTTALDAASADDAEVSERDAVSEPGIVSN
jgi:DNA recombination protein RmuC